MDEKRLIDEERLPSTGSRVFPKLRIFETSRISFSTLVLLTLVLVNARDDFPSKRRIFRTFLVRKAKNSCSQRFSWYNSTLCSAQMITFRENLNFLFRFEEEQKWTRPNASTALYESSGPTITHRKTRGHNLSDCQQFR